MLRTVHKRALAVALPSLIALALPAAAGAYAMDGTSAPSPGQIDAAAGPDGGFPVRGKYDFGTYENGFGGGRGHDGQDLLAECGTPVAAIRPGKVTVADWHGAAGNFLVIAARDGTNQVYMHLLHPPRLAPGDRVEGGDRLGRVGQTGRASTCHLHFEQWTAPGWYEGGRPVDPAPLLRKLAAAD